MKAQRVWVSAVLLVLALGAMYAVNTVSQRPKPPPDVELTGRLASENDIKGGGPTQTDPADNSTGQDEETSDQAGTDTTTKETAPVSEDEKSITENAQGSVVRLDTGKGAIYLALYDDKTPVTVGNFLDLVGSGYYDGLKFHRVIPNFMIQGGCPKGDGTSGPGWTIPDEADKGLKHARGSLSMAKTAMPNTGGSQFFVCHTPQPHLDGVHTVFGECVEGMDVVDSIAKDDTITKATVLKQSDGADDCIKQAEEARVPE